MGWQCKHVNVDTVQTPNAAITPLSLVFNTPYANGLTLQGTNSIATGGVLVGANVGANPSTIAGGTLTGPANGDLVLNQRNTNNSLTIGSIIVDNGTTNLLKTGLGTAILTAANSYTGSTTIAAGSLQINDPAAIGGAGVIIGGSGNASLLLGDNLVVPPTKSITLAGGGAGQYYGALSTATGNTGTSEWQGPVTIGALTATRIGTLGGTLLVSGNIGEAAAGSQLLVRNNETVGGTTVLSGNNTFTGGLTLVVGNLRMASASALGSGTLSLGSGTNANAFSSDGSTPRTVANPVALTATGTIGLGDATLAGKLLFTNTVEVGTANRTVSTASEVEITGNLAGTANFIKTGTAPLTLSGVNSLTGQVWINGGTLVVAHKNALATCASVFPSTTGGSGTLRLATDESVVVNRLETSSSNPGTILSDRATAGAGINHHLGAGWFGANTYTFAAGPNVTSGTAGITLSSGNLTAGSASTAVLNPTTAVVTIAGPVNIGLNNQAKTLRLDGASSGNLIAGAVSNGLNTLSLLKAGTSTWELSGVTSQTGATTVANGTLILSGNRVAGSAAVTVGNTAGQTGTLEIRGDLPMTSQEFGVGTSVAGAAGIVNHSAGKVSFSAGNALLLGRTTGGVSGTYNLSGGELQTYASTSRGVMIGVNAGAAGIPITAAFNLSGTGFLNNAAGTLQVVRGDNTASYQNSTYHQTGGTSANGYLVIGGGVNGAGGVNAAFGANSTATFAITGGTFTANVFAGLSRADHTASTITIGGTADVTLPAFPTARGTSSAATLYFDGGTLRPSASSAAYISGLTGAFIKSGGAKFHVGTDREITVSQILLEDGGSTGGGLTKEGTGRLNLTGANTYAGNTTVTAGILSLGAGSANTALADGANVSVASSATLDLNYSGTDTVNALWLGSVQQPAGIYGSTHPSGLITGTGTLTVTTGPSGDPYTTWADGYKLSGGPNDDDDKDGLSNFEEYAFGLNPTTGSSVNPISQPLDKATGQFKYTRRATPETSGVSYSYESSATLSGAWPVFTPASAVSNNTSPVEEITVTVPAGLLANPALFIRVRAVKP